MTEEKNKSLWAKVLGVVKLEPLGEILHNVGGRKAGLVVLGVYAIVRIVEGAIAKAPGGVAPVSAGLGLACLGIGIAVGGGAIATAWEDRAKKEKG